MISCARSGPEAAPMSGQAGVGGSDAVFVDAQGGDEVVAHRSAASNRPT